MGIRHLEQWWIGLAGCALLAAGCRTPARVDVRDLPLSQCAAPWGHHDPLPRVISVHVIQPGAYSVGGETVMNQETLARFFSKESKEWGADMPVFIRSRPATPFGVVWSVVKSASTNGLRPEFAVRMPGSSKQESLEFDAAEPVPAPSNSVRIACRKEGLQIERRAVTPEELRRMLSYLSALSKDICISITATDDFAYQGVIDVLAACEHVGFQQRILRLEKK